MNHFEFIFHPETGQIDRVYSNGEKKENVGANNGNGYIRIGINRRKKYAHRLMWERFNGAIPSGLLIDHINGIKSDNRLANLRLVNKSENGQNRLGVSQRSSSGVKGVSWDPANKKWRALIGVNYKSIPIGRFQKKEDAAFAYAEAAKKYHTHNPSSIITELGPR